MMSKKKESDDNLNLNIDPEIEDSSTEDSEDVVWENVEEQSEKAEEFSKEAEELNFKYMRLAADFKNFRRRAEKEKSDIYAYANEKIVVELLDVIDNFEGYTEDAYKKFKKGCLVAATGFNTNSKSGSENEFAIFIEVKEEEQLYLANLDSYISFIKNTGDKDIIDITELKEMLRKIEDKIHNIEIYYNTHTVQIDTTGLKCNAYDIFDEVK
jgi:hypothetical protein